MKDHIIELQSKTYAIRSYIDIEVNIDNISKPYLSKNKALIAQKKRRNLAIEGHDKSWYFDNTALYYITYNLANFQETALSKCQYLQDNIILANRSTLIPDGIGIVSLLFYIHGHTKKNSLFRICYDSKLNTKLISFGMFDKKELVYTL